MNSPIKTIDSLNENSGKLEQLLCLLSSGEISTAGSYLRWSDLPQEAPPQYLAIREWWLALKLQRLLGRQEIGLKDSQGAPFTLGSGEFFAAAIHVIDRASQSPSGSGGTTAKGVVDQVSVWAIREEAIASAQLDGLVVDPVIARELLSTGRKPANTSEQAVQNTFRVLGRIQNIRTRPLTLALLAEIHQQLCLGTVAKAGIMGRLRQTTSEKQPPAEELPVRLKAMLSFANGHTPEHFVHPLLRAAALHFWVLHDQPFAEGNGRLARALFYWSVLHAGYPLFENLSVSASYRDAPTAYRAAYDEVARDENDLLHFVAHVFYALAKAQRRSADELKRIEEELQHTAELPDTVKALNPRQRLLVTQALREPGFRRTLQEHARNHNLVRQTARHDFAPLLKLGWFEETKVGRALAFFPAPDLAERLHQPHLS